MPTLKDRAEGMHLFQVDVVYVRLACGVATLLADVRFVSAFLVGEVQLEPVHLATVGLERAALCEGLVTVVAFVRSNALKREQRSINYCTVDRSLNPSNNHNLYNFSINIYPSVVLN